MYNIKTLNKIAPIGLEQLDSGKYAVSEDCAAPNGILVRSADMLEAQLPESLLAIARAGAGTNNIPIDRCSEAGIVVFNTPGANANAVKELTTCALLMACRKVAAGSKWLDAQMAQGLEVAEVVEKGKSQFVGPELMGKTLGVIGLGAIGVQVANTAAALDMKVLGYDPFLSVHWALSLSRAVQFTPDLDELYRQSDYITIHVPLNKDTKGMICAASIAKMKDGARVINMARGGLVSDGDMVDALKAGKIQAYVTDFPTNTLLRAPNVTALPHLGASTPESEENCAVMAARELADYLENGNIVHSVNLPECTMPWSGAARLCILHRNVPGMLADITAALSAEGMNVENLTNKSRGDYAYTMVDTDKIPAGAVVEHIQALDSVLRVRMLER